MQIEANEMLSNRSRTTRGNTVETGRIHHHYLAPLKRLLTVITPYCEGVVYAPKDALATEPKPEVRSNHKYYKIYWKIGHPTVSSFTLRKIINKHMKVGTL